MHGSYKDVGRFCGSMAAGYGKNMSQGGGSFYITIIVILFICFFLYFITSNNVPNSSLTPSRNRTQQQEGSGFFSLSQSKGKKQMEEKIAQRVIPEVEYCYVERCVDGDTIIVNSGIIRERVRFIGIDTPEMASQNNNSAGSKRNTSAEPFAVDALEYVEKRIKEFGNRVYLKADGNKTDRYGRRLALIYLDEKGNYLLNEELVRNGLAHAELQYNFSTAIKEQLCQAENKAKEEKRGLWNTAETPVTKTTTKSAL